MKREMEDYVEEELLGKKVKEEGLLSKNVKEEGLVKWELFVKERLKISVMSNKYMRSLEKKKGKVVLVGVGS